MGKRTQAIVRAVGVMGATAAIVVGATFAALSSNTVKLTDNTLSSTTAALQISNNTTDFSSSVTGMSFTNLVPGQASSPFTFELKNTGGVGLDVTAQIPDDLSSSSIDPNKLTLTFSDGVNTPVSYTLAQLNAGPQPLPGSPTIASGATNTYNVTATLDSSVTSSGSVPPFTINFVGTQH